MKNREKGKVVSYGAMAMVLFTAVVISFHLARPAQNSGSSSTPADLAPQAKNEMSTPSGWEKLAPVNPNLDVAEELEIISLHSREKITTPAGWEKITSAVATTPSADQIAEPLAPQLLPPPISADLPQGDGSGDSSAPTSAASSKHFPTEQRVWTNFKGQLMVASVIQCDFDTGELLMESDQGILRNYQLAQLSDADRAYLWNLAEKQ